MNETPKKTVLDLDLVGYSDIARTLDENQGPETILTLNADIQNLVDRGLAEARAPRDQTVLATTGDGAILAFDKANQAHQFAASVHRAACEHNCAKAAPLAKRLFRMGAATGKIAVRPRPSGGFEFGGVIIADAVRLEAAARPGELLIDRLTFKGLTPSYRQHYGEEEKVQGKRQEIYHVRRWPRDSAATTDGARAASPPDLPPVAEGKRVPFEDGALIQGLKHLDFLDKMERLCAAEGALLLLMQTLDMLPRDRPQSGTPGELCLKIYDYAAARNKVSNLAVLVERLILRFGV